MVKPLWLPYGLSPQFKKQKHVLKILVNIHKRAHTTDSNPLTRTITCAHILTSCLFFPLILSHISLSLTLSLFLFPSLLSLTYSLIYLDRHRNKCLFTCLEGVQVHISVNFIFFGVCAVSSNLGTGDESGKETIGLLQQASADDQIYGSFIYIAETKEKQQKRKRRGGKKDKKKKKQQEQQEEEEAIL